MNQHPRRRRSMSRNQTIKMKWGYYAELTPETLAAIRGLVPVAYLPWGALDWHGPHLPFGVDGLIAQAVAERVAERVGGVLLPPTWWPVTVIPHPDSLAIRSDIMQMLWGHAFGRLASAGWKVVVVLSGPAAHGHELVLIDAAEKAIRQHGLLVLALPPLAIVDEAMLDHAALWETSLMMTLYPDLVHLEALGHRPLNPASSAVVGRDPRGTASASLGKQALAMAVEQISRAIRQLLTECNATPSTRSMPTGGPFSVPTSNATGRGPSMRGRGPGGKMCAAKPGDRLGGRSQGGR
ncbi:MAG: creatininase family protein, partial [Chloroflexaceae bacterium]|nr:creatininase family protein [Chloroflexaceae bacterium]